MTLLEVTHLGPLNRYAHVPSIKKHQHMIDEEVLRLYQRRFQVETLFSDQKSQGFHIHKSHVAALKRLSRLLMTVSLAYL